MPVLQISCHYCGNSEELEGTFIPDEWDERCEFCNNDICPKCRGKGDEPLHPDCAEAMEEDDDEDEAPAPAKKTGKKRVKKT